MVTGLFLFDWAAAGMTLADASSEMTSAGKSMANRMGRVSLW